MKKLILFLSICLIGFINQSKAQALSLQVNNTTGCDVFYIINGDPSRCMASISSPLISLSAGGTAIYASSSTIPGFPTAPVQLLSAMVFTSSNACAIFPVSQIIGEPCTGFPTSVNYQVYTSGCVLCRATPITATWVPPVFPSTMATLNFN